MKILLLTCAALALSGCATLPSNETRPEDMSVTLATATRVINARGDIETPTSTFIGQTPLTVRAEISWPDQNKVGGEHIMTVRFYQYGGLRLEASERFGPMRSTPYRVWYNAHTSKLGLGDFKVEMLIDNQLKGTTSFTISAK